MAKAATEYACVFYIEEESYASVRAEKIAYNKTLYPSVHDTIGIELPVVWEDTGNAYNANILDVGKKSKMAKMAASLAKEARDRSFNDNVDSGQKRARSHSDVADQDIENRDVGPKRNKRKKVQTVHEGALDIIQALNFQHTENISLDCVDSTGTFNSLTEQQPGVNADTLDQSSNSLVNAIAERDIEIENLRRKLLREKNKVYNLQRKRSTSEQVELQEFNYGLTISKQLVESIRDRYRGSPPQFLRAMMEQTGAFTLQEIAEHSVYGRKSSSNPNLVRAALPQKFIALKEFVIAESGLERGSAAFLKFEVSVRGICSDARKRLKNLSTSAQNSM